MILLMPTSARRRRYDTTSSSVTPSLLQVASQLNHSFKCDTIIHAPHVLMLPMLDQDRRPERLDCANFSKTEYCNLYTSPCSPRSFPATSPINISDGLPVVLS